MTEKKKRIQMKTSIMRHGENGVGMTSMTDILQEYFNNTVDIEIMQNVTSQIAKYAEITQSVTTQSTENAGIAQNITPKD